LVLTRRRTELRTQGTSVFRARARRKPPEVPTRGVAGGVALAAALVRLHHTAERLACERAIGLFAKIALEGRGGLREGASFERDHAEVERSARCFRRRRVTTAKLEECPASLVVRPSVARSVGTHRELARRRLVIHTVLVHRPGASGTSIIPRTLKKR
jgi:hypothetical protein